MTNVSLNLDNGSPEQKQFASEAIQRLIPIVNDPNFLKEILSTHYSDTLFRTDNDITISATNQQVVDAIVTGKEFKTPPNNQIDLKVAFEYLNDDDVVGGSTPPDPLITTNLTFVDWWMEKNDSLSLAAHWLHEWMHVAGFRHRRMRPDVNDVVYKVGYMVLKYGKVMAQMAGENSDLIARLGAGFKEVLNKELENDQSTIS